MPKTLLLVRHAKSGWAESNQRDIDRPLNNRGRRDAPEMGRRIQASGLLPEIILCSPATRTRETLQLLNLGTETIIFDESIYESTAENLLSVIRRIHDSAEVAMLIGHNPGITWVAAGLSGQRIENLPTCSVVQIQLETAQWSEAGKCSAALLNLDYPKKTP